MSAPPVVNRMLAEAGLSADDDVATLLTALHAMGDGPAPEPNPELAERLGVTSFSKPRRWLRRRVVGGATAVALAVVSGTGVAAAANELPAGVQRLVARFSENFLPFDFPAPVESGPVPAHLGTRPADRSHDREGGVDGERSPGTDHAAMAAERSHRPAVTSVRGLPAPEGGHVSGDEGTRPAGDDGTASDGAGGDSSDDGSRTGDGSRDRTDGSTEEGSTPDSGGDGGTQERSDGSGSTDDGSHDSGSGAGSTDPDDDPDSPSESGGSDSGGG